MVGTAEGAGTALDKPIQYSATTATAANTPNAIPQGRELFRWGWAGGGVGAGWIGTGGQYGH